MATESLSVTLRTLTPIWTGGVETGKMDRLHESGVIGSLRWWYEAIVRGLGGAACDPTEHACLFDPEKPNNGLCDVCQLFGATGWRRRFSLQIAADTRSTWSDLPTLNIRPFDRTRGWYLPPGEIGSLTLHFAGDQATLKTLKSLLVFMEMYGNLGARPQVGYGRFQITGLPDDPDHGNWIMMRDAKVGSMPDLRSFTFFTLQFEPRQSNWWQQVSGIPQLPRDRRSLVDTLVNRHGLFPITPALKNYLRYQLAPAWSPDIAHWLFGTLNRDQRLRSKMSLSWAYQRDELWQIDGWVYIPQDNLGRANHREIVHKLQQAFDPPQKCLQGIGVASSYNFAMKMKVSPGTSPWELHTPQQIERLLNEQATR
jgi:CRISPR-associated protein Cmr1